MDCGTIMVKYILFIFNALCSICGIFLIVFGAPSFNIVYIVLGLLVLSISSLGCSGAITESYSMSMAYSVMLLTVLIAQLVAVFYCWVNKVNFVESIDKIFDKAWGVRIGNIKFMDFLQAGLKCCGENGPSDYLITISLPPSSCCKGNDCSNPFDIYTRGCKSTIMDFWSDMSDIIKFVGFVIVVIELVCFIFGFCLANNIHNYKRRAADSDSDSIEMQEKKYSFIIIKAPIVSVNN